MGVLRQHGALASARGGEMRLPRSPAAAPFLVVWLSIIAVQLHAEGVLDSAPVNLIGNALVEPIKDSSEPAAALLPEEHEDKRGPVGEAAGGDGAMDTFVSQADKLIEAAQEKKKKILDKEAEDIRRRKEAA